MFEGRPAIWYRNVPLWLNIAFLCSAGIVDVYVEGPPDVTVEVQDLCAAADVLDVSTTDLERIVLHHEGNWESALQVLSRLYKDWVQQSHPMRHVLQCSRTNASPIINLISYLSAHYLPQELHDVKLNDDAAAAGATRPVHRLHPPTIPEGGACPVDEYSYPHSLMHR